MTTPFIFIGTHSIKEGKLQDPKQYEQELVALVEATGTVLRAPTVARWAAAAGFTGFEVLAIDNPFWRFYRMHG